MKLRNKKTGEIVDTLCRDDITKGLAFGIDHHDGNPTMAYYNSLAELNAEWEDYEEPKGKALYWMILTLENFIENEPDDKWVDLEDCKQMLEKLKAWKRLEDLGFKCSYHSSGYHRGTFTADFIFDEDKLPIMDTFVAKDLNLLFGGEE